MGFTNSRSFRGTKDGTKIFFWGVVAIVLIVFIAILVGNSQLRSEGYIKIEVPDMRGSYTSYWCKEYKEENGCVIFTDHSGRTRKICGSYQIIK